MCFSTNIIEQQAFLISDKIINNSIYKPVSLNFIDEKNVGISDFTMKSFREEIPLITRVNIENSEGLLISLEPNENGLRCTMGEISYKAFKKLRLIING